MTRDPHEREGEERTGLSAGKKLFVFAALAFIAVGLILRFRASQSGGGAGLPDGAHGLTPGGSGGEGAADAATPWSAFFLKGGGGMFLGFCIGYALRSFLKISMLAIGLGALALAGLHYGGVVEVDWTAISERADRMLAGAREHLSGFQAFLASHLPATAFSAVGLFAGFTRRS